MTTTAKVDRQPRPAELVLHNARIHTMETARPKAEALAVRDGQFVAVGRWEEIEPLIGPATTLVDGGGAMVMPGLLDSHCHAYEGARADLYEVRLSPSVDIDPLLGAVVKALPRVPKGGWLRGAGWNAGRMLPQLSSGDALKRLDELTGEHPVVLRDSSHHTMFANTAAMRAAGVDHQVTDPENGSVGRDAAGALSGLFFENACGLIERASPPDSAEVQEAAALHASRIYNRFGVTGFVQAAASRKILDAFSGIDRAGRSSTWIAACISTDSLITPEGDGVGDPVIAERARYRSAHLGVDFVKFFMDGVPSARTAAFSAPYAPDDRGRIVHQPSFYTVAELHDRIKPLDAAGIRVKIHAVGDQAISDTLDAIEAVRRANGPEGPQHSIAHLGYIRPNDVPRVAALNVIADFCPPLWFPNPIIAANAKALGDDRGMMTQSIADVVRSGAVAVLGTDWPIIASPNPWPGLAAMITRRDPSGQTPGVFRPEQALRLEEVLPMCTINVARCMGIDNETGSIVEGKAADFVLLDRDLFSVEPQAIAETSVRQTFFAGRLVYEA